MFVNTEKGEAKMCEVVEQLAKERVLNMLFECVQDGGLTISFAAKKANLSPDEFKEQMRLKGFTAPQRTSRRGRAIPKE